MEIYRGKKWEDTLECHILYFHIIDGRAIIWKYQYNSPIKEVFFWIFPYNYPSSIYFLILSYVSTNIKDNSKNYFQIITTFEYNYF